MKTIIFTYGRCNPPTIAHQMLIEQVMGLANDLDADHCVFISQIQNSKNPLSWDDRKNILRLSVPGVNISDDQKIKTPFQALEMIAQSGYKKIIMIVGEDRIENFSIRMTPYAKEWGVDEFEIRSAGIRCPDASDVTGVSASKLRQFAVEGKIKEFFEGLPSTLNDNMKMTIFTKLEEINRVKSI